MKRLVSKQDEEKRRKRNQVIVGVFLGIVMILSTIGFALQSSPGNTGTTDPNKIRYNDYEFSYINGLWVLGNYAFKYNPQEVLNVNPQVKDATYYQGLPIYIYSEDEEAEIEIYVNMAQFAGRVQKACPQGSVCAEDIPIKTCADNFIIIKESNNTAITQNENCVYIEGPKFDLTKLSDEFLFKILGIR